MSLIKCPECNKEVSDKAEKCIHCGYPLRSTPYIHEVINGKEFDCSFLLDQSISPIQKIKQLKELTGCDLHKAKEIVDKYHPTTKSAKENNNTDNRPKCPTCGSTDITKISGTKRWFTVGLFGLASSDVGKSMCCKKCGYKW